MKSILLTTLNAKYIHSSLALRYLQAFSRQDTLLQIDLKEFSINEVLADIMAQIYSQQPDILCFSCYIWNIRSILEICRDYKKVSPETIIILGGPEVSYDADKVLRENPVLDFIVRGEGEASFKELLLALDNESSYQFLQGISYRSHKEICHNPDRPLICDLDIVPFPYPMNLEDFKDKIVYYESSRGCPFNCSYCLSSTQRGVRYFSMERVKQDLNILLTQEVREIKFVDRTFNCNEGRAIEIMSFLIDQEAASKFHFELDVSLISDEMLNFLATVPANRFNFEIGIQSTFPAALQAVQRSYNWEKQSRNIQILKSFNNIHLHLDLIAGLPYEGYSEFAHSFNDVYSLEPDVLQLGFLKLLKGSRMRELASEHGLIYQEEAPYQLLANQYISYSQMITLKQIEEILDKYHNSGDMRLSLAYIVSSVYDNDAFAFFEDFASYWKSENLFQVGHKKDRLYSFLLAFISREHVRHADIVNDLLKYDFLMRNRSDLLPAGLWTYNPEGIKEEIYSFIKDETFNKEHLGRHKFSSPREIRKNLHLEYFRWDPDKQLLSDKFFRIMFVYDPVKKHAYKTIPLE